MLVGSGLRSQAASWKANALRRSARRAARASSRPRQATRSRFRSPALCFGCYRAGIERERALKAAGELDTASVERFQSALPFEPVNQPRLQMLKAERSAARRGHCSRVSAGSWTSDVTRRSPRGMRCSESRPASRLGRHAVRHACGPTRARWRQPSTPPSCSSRSRGFRLSSRGSYEPGTGQVTKDRQPAVLRHAILVPIEPLILLGVAGRRPRHRRARRLAGRASGLRPSRRPSSKRIAPSTPSA